MINLDSLYRVYTEYDVPYSELQQLVMKEVKIMNVLSHPNIVSLIETFAIDRTIYIAMEFVDGKDLLHYIPSEGMPEETAKYFFQQICTAIAFCHAHNVRRTLRFSSRFMDDFISLFSQGDSW
jgi:5'-AMP-activated protein kinase catalytic alpha subunit